MQAPLPHEYLPQVPSFTLTSDDIHDGGTLPTAQVYDGWGFTGDNVSPHLSWSGFPPEAQSFAVTCYDPDAPTGSGFWHWLLWDVPAHVTELKPGIGPDDPIGVQGRNDYGDNAFGGAGPPPGPAHRYVFTVHALDVPSLGLTPDTPTGQIGFNITAHTVARAHLVATYGQPV